MIKYILPGFIYTIVAFTGGVAFERYYGVEVRADVAAIDACAREANVYPESCAMKAVVVSPTQPRTAALPDLLPPPVEG